MKVILLENVKGKGKKDDIINVSDGYGNNYLLKNKLAVLYTDGSKKFLQQEIDKRQKEENLKIAEFEKIKNQLENKTLVFKVKTGESDKVFGNISSKQISDEIKKKGYLIDKKCIKIENNINSLGTHKILIELHKKVKFFINVVLEK